MITIEEFKKKQLNTSRLIGLDLGSKRIGVAICDENQKIATPLKTINKSKFNIKGIIIGNPINMDGSLGKSSQSVNDVSKAISKEIDLPISLWDERLSTVGAFKLTENLGINVTKREKNIDKNAAAFILQGAIDFINN